MEYKLIRFCLFILVGSLFFSVKNGFAQIDQLDVFKRDSIINNSYELKLEILKLKEKVSGLEGQIRSMRSNISELTGKVKVLKGETDKTKDDYRLMEQYAMQILAQNDSLNMTNDNLLTLNSQLTDSKESIEIAANALTAVLKNERSQYNEQINSLMKSISVGCTDVRHLTRKGEVVLDESNTHKLTWIDDFNVTINTCYALPVSKAGNNMRVYFSLYRKNDTHKSEPLESNIPIVLLPNTDVSDDIVIYYDGSATVSLPSDKKKDLKTSYLYEVEYEEAIIAYGTFKLD